MITPYSELRKKIVFELLDKFPNAPSLTIARICYRDNKELFKDIEDARYIIRNYRGATGDYKRNHLKNRKYVKQQQSI